MSNNANSRKMSLNITMKDANGAGLDISLANIPEKHSLPLINKAEKLMSEQSSMLNFKDFISDVKSISVNGQQTTVAKPAPTSQSNSQGFGSQQR